MKILKLAVLSIFLFVGIFMFYPQTQSVLSKSDDSVESDKKASRSLYLNNCARCHGADGKGNTSLGKKLDATDLTSQRVQKMSRKKIARVIYYGDDPMPSFGKKLTKKEIDSIADYVRALN
jgi:mono/diheme cytochrome c family protein